MKKQVCRSVKIQCGVYCSESASRTEHNRPKRKFQWSLKGKVILKLTLERVSFPGRHYREEVSSTRACKIG
jgi:hypothetical protein